HTSSTAAHEGFSLSHPVFHRTVCFELHLFTFHIFAFVIFLLTFGHAEEHFAYSVFNIELKGNQGITALLDVTHQLVDLFSVKQEFSRTEGIMVITVTLFIRCDVHIVHIHLTSVCLC